jgi:hypothetical protein
VGSQLVLNNGGVGFSKNPSNTRAALLEGHFQALLEACNDTPGVLCPKYEEVQEA